MDASDEVLLMEIKTDDELHTRSRKEQCAYVVSKFQDIAGRRGVELKLRRKK